MHGKLTMECWKIKFLIAMTLMFGNSDGFGQIDARGSGKPWPKLYKVSMKVGIIVQGDTYTYAYEVDNSTKNMLPISRVEIDLRLNPSEHPLLRQDLTINHGFVEHRALLSQSVRTPIISTAIPFRWYADYSGAWWTRPNERMIKPGEVLGGFTVTTNLPPGIRDWVVDAYSWDFAENSEEYKFEGTSDELFIEANKGIQYLGHTVAPVSPPEPFTVSTWTARMLSDADEARKLEWICTDEQLANIRRLIKALNTENKKSLKKTVREVERYVLGEKKSGRMEDEADALIRLNALYLLKMIERNPGVKER